MKTTLIPLLIAISSLCFSQTFQSADTVNAPANHDNIYVRSLYSDSLASSFVIFIKKEVKAHKHIFHSEHIYVLQGEAKMKLGDKEFAIKRGDVVFIPKNTSHAVQTTSNEPLKVISIQAPYFDGKDRVMLE